MTLAWTPTSDARPGRPDRRCHRHVPWLLRMPNGIARRRRWTCGPPCRDGKWGGDTAFGPEERADWIEHPTLQRRSLRRSRHGSASDRKAASPPTMQAASARRPCPSALPVCRARGRNRCPNGVVGQISWRRQSPFPRTDLSHSSPRDTIGRWKRIASLGCIEPARSQRGRALRRSCARRGRWVRSAGWPDLNRQRGPAKTAAGGGLRQGGRAAHFLRSRCDDAS